MEKTNAFRSYGKVVAIASSTGGPKALQTLLPMISEKLDAPVLIVQHMPENFTAALAERLNSLSGLEIKEAQEGDRLEAGHVYLAKGGIHMRVCKVAGRHLIRFSDEPPREGVKPCANYLYESLETSGYDEVICVVLTGMGADGTQGITNLKQRKNVTVFAQNEESCAVFGMPRSAIKAGLADKGITLEQIAHEIEKNAGVK